MTKKIIQKQKPGRVCQSKRAGVAFFRLLRRQRTERQNARDHWHDTYAKEIGLVGSIEQAITLYRATPFKCSYVQKRRLLKKWFFLCSTTEEFRQFWDVAYRSITHVQSEKRVAYDTLGYTQEDSHFFCKLFQRWITVMHKRARESMTFEEVAEALLMELRIFAGSGSQAEGYTQLFQRLLSLCTTKKEARKIRTILSPFYGERAQKFVLLIESSPSIVPLILSVTPPNHWITRSLSRRKESGQEKEKS